MLSTVNMSKQIGRPVHEGGSFISDRNESGLGRVDISQRQENYHGTHDAALEISIS